MAKYSPNRTPHYYTDQSSGQRLHQTTVVLDRDTIAYLRNHSRKNADFNRRVSELDWSGNDFSEEEYTNRHQLKNYRIQADNYSRSSYRRSSQSTTRSTSAHNSNVSGNAHHRKTSSADGRADRNSHAYRRASQEQIPKRASSSRNSSKRSSKDNYLSSGDHNYTGSKKSAGKARSSSGNIQYRKKKRKKKHSKALLIILPIAVILLAAIAYVGVNLVIAKNQASKLKDGLETVLEYAKEKDADNAEKALLKSIDDRERLNATLNSGFWSIASKIDRVNEEMTAGKELLGVVQTAQDDLLTPLVALMKKQPLTDLKVGDDGFNVTLINSYLDFVEEKQPVLESLMNKIMAIDTESMMGDYVTKYKDKLYEYTDAYNEASSMLPLLRVFLGNGEDRLYLFVAQNSAEIRASGGFPGSIGTIRIQDGILTIGDFESVYDVLADTISYQSEVTDGEYNIFGSWINAPRDACFIPAFDRTAQIWAVAYEDLQRENGAIDTYEGYVKANTYYDEWSEEYYFDGISEEEYNAYFTYEDAEYMEYVDGVVSLTPAIIQMLLEDIGEVTLSDGTTLDSTNATRILQHELYHRFFDEDTYVGSSNSESDALFAETAKIAMKEFVSNFEISKFADYYKLFQKGKDKNIIQMWMEDEAEEEVITETGFSGKLNFDPEDPFTGIYFSLADPSKLGWYLDIIPEISEPTVNEDGTRTYDVKVTLRNIIDEEETLISSWYIVGQYGGAIRGFIHCFAPAGGYISDIETSNGMYMFEAFYKDLEVYYDLDILLDPGEEVEITYKVTTAEGVETPLRAVTTPTLTEYR